MGYEIDFLPVGDGEKGGDAIALRFGNLFGDRAKQFVMVVDGGYSDSGEALVKHIKKYYKTDIVDLVLCTHPDLDHVSGLKKVVENLSVKEMAIHLPWTHADSILQHIKDGRVTTSSAENRLQQALVQAYDLVELAQKHNPYITIWEPFQGQKIPFLKDYEITVLGPNEERYHKLIAQYLNKKQKDKKTTVTGTLKEGLEETFKIETLKDPADDDTSFLNNTSVILHCSLKKSVLFLTGDAGIVGLNDALAYADSNKITYYRPSLIKIPHHGSKRNIGPSLLNKILGPIGQKEAKSCYVSCPPKGAPKHPSKAVLNAFKRRGYKAHKTAGKTKRQYSNAPDRGWSKAIPLPFYSRV